MIVTLSKGCQKQLETEIEISILNRHKHFSGDNLSLLTGLIDSATTLYCKIQYCPKHGRSSNGLTLQYILSLPHVWGWLWVFVFNNRKNLKYWKKGDVSVEPLIFSNISYFKSGYSKSISFMHSAVLSILGSSHILKVVYLRFCGTAPKVEVLIYWQAGYLRFLSELLLFLW